MNSNTCENLKSKYRTHTCVELRAKDVGQEVVLSGWIMRKRDHGGVVFVDLRDHYGVTQVVFNDNCKEEIQNLRIESVITIQGSVINREASLINPKIPTGEIEVICKSFDLISAAEVLPFLIAEDDNAPEPIRLRSRFLELRREKLHNNIVLRCNVIRRMRELMHAEGFLEVQTPILTSSSPEGARDYIVPSRLHPGKFFALPQAPQQFKQLLMTSGFDRYFQIAACFRDEDARADRSPGEFYQLDMEFAFIEQEDAFKVNERLFSTLFSEFSDYNVSPLPFPRIKYKDSMEQFGCDKPDLRNPLRIKDVSALFTKSEFRVFKDVLAAPDGVIKVIPCKVKETPSRKYFDDTIADFSKKTGRGLAYLVYEGEAWKGSVLKFFSEDELSALTKELALEAGTILFFVAGPRKATYSGLANLRNKLGKDFDLLEEKAWRFCWVVDYPFYEINPDTGAVEFSHNPFSMPQGGLEALDNANPEEILAYQYDFVLNGNELASGAIRNHSPEIMYKAFAIAGYGPEVVEEKFGGMLRAFKYGAPPHGGMAHGIERIVMLLAGEEAIREVIPFPLAQTGEDLLMGAPSNVNLQQLRDVHIRIELPKAMQKAENA